MEGDPEGSGLPKWMRQRWGLLEEDQDWVLSIIDSSTSICLSLSNLV